MASIDNDKQVPGGQEGTTGNDMGMNESRAALDADEGNMQNGKIGGAGLPENIDSSTESSSAGSAGGDVSGSGAATGGQGNS